MRPSYSSNKGVRITRGLRFLKRSRNLESIPKFRRMEDSVSPSVLYASELWSLSAKQRRIVEVLAMKRLRRALGVNVWIRLRI